MKETSCSNEFKSRISFSEKGFTFQDETDSIGVKNLGLRLAIDKAFHGFVPTNAKKGKGGLSISGKIGRLSASCEIRMLSKINAATIHFSLKNDSAKKVKISDIQFGIFSDDAAVLAGKSSTWDFKYCHTDNVRTELYPYCQGESPFVRSLPVRETLLGAGEDQAFPAIYFTDKKYNNGLVIAAATQDNSFQTWAIKKDPFGAKSILEKFSIKYDRCQSSHLEIKSGESFEMDSTYFQIMKDRHPQCAYDDYVDWLSEKLPLLGKKTPLLRNAFHCTWNYGVFDRQFEKNLLKIGRASCRERV